MQFYSHSKTVSDNSRTGTKLLKEHIQGVTKKALESFEHTVSLTFENNYLATLVGEVCKYHDLGKYTSYFQKYLLTSENVDLHLKQHSRFGAYCLFEKYKDKNVIIAVFLYYIIVNHHSNLGDISNTEFSRQIDCKTNKGIFEKQKSTVLEFIKVVEDELIEDFEQFLNQPDGRDFYRVIKQITFKEASIANYFLINYLFSLLIEADKLDASNTPLHTRKTIGINLVNRHRPLSVVSAEEGSIKNFSQNQLRSYARLKVIQFLEGSDWHCSKLFTLTAPTGIGKTLIALDFALKLKAKIREKEQREAQIIYALPFINIIEQSYEVYQEVLKDQDASLLAQYQYADALEQIKPKKGQADIDNEKEYDQKVMTLDTWQADIIITTFVQFLQTLIGNRNKLLKKFNHFAGSIIILDEVQTLRLAYLPLIGASLHYLTKFLNARVVLMTATKPKVFELANQEILKAENEEAKPIELLSNFEEVFQCFQRTAIWSLIHKPIEDEQDFLNNYFLEKWSEDSSCIIVCNTVKRSLDVFILIRGTVENPVYYLSTNIVPFQRQVIIDEIKSDLANQLKPILVSTQCVEAGVDLDFDMGFRDLSPIDSIVQVAGRINRNNNPEKKYSPLYVVDFGDCQKIYDPITRVQSKNALERFSTEIKEEQYLELIDGYFEKVSGNKSFAISRDIFQAMKILKYDSENPKKDIAVSSFQVISEDYPVISVFVELDEESTNLKDLFVRLIHKEITQEEFSGVKKSFHQRIISVPGHLPKAIEIKTEKKYSLCDGLYFIPFNELNDFYEVVTGFNRDKEDKQHSMFL